MNKTASRLQLLGSRKLRTVSQRVHASTYHLVPSTFSVKPRSGFTLIETLVAISVILLSLVGPLSIAAQSLSAAYYSRDQITAFYLAQEGVEYVRAVRDQNFLDGNPATGWLSGLSDCIDNSCEVDLPSFGHTTCSGPCDPVRVHDSSGLFNMLQGTPSIYTRSVRIETVPDHPNEVLVRVTISWMSAGINRSYEVSEQLFDWL